MRAAFAACLLWGAGLAWATPYDDGKDAFARQDWKAASQSLAKFVADSPDSPDAPAAAFLRGVALYQAGDFRTSLDAFQKLERTWPQSSYSPRLPYWKGTAALAAGQATLAERELLAQTQIASEDVFRTRALLNLAIARQALGKDLAAVEAVKQFTETSTEATLLAQAWALWGDWDKKAGRNEDALAHYRAAWSAHPGDRWDLSSRTQAIDLLTTQGRFNEAGALLADSAAKFPDADRWDSRRIGIARGLGDSAALLKALESQWSREPDPTKKQELASNRARAGEESGHPDAGWWLRASVGPRAELGLAAILRYAFLVEKAGKPADAAQALEAWARTPSAGVEEARTRAAQDRLIAGDDVKAAQAWDKLIADFPRSARLPSWLLARGRVRLDAGDTTRALADFGRLLKDYPQAAEAPEARYQTGAAYIKRQEPARAEAWFYGLVQDLGSGELYERALLARGVSFVNAGKTDLARGSLERLIRESPQGVWTGDAWAALGRNALQASLFEEAADAFARAESTQTDLDAKARALWSRAEALAARPSGAEEASRAYARFAADYPGQTRAGEALYRQGAVFAAVKDWPRAQAVWSSLVGSLRGEALSLTREGLANALLRLGRIDEAWAQMESLEAASPRPEAWYRWGLAATSAGEGEWAVKAFQYLLQHHPDSSVAEAALPRAAGALLNGGRPAEALSRYADYFGKYGRQSSSAPVARAAAAGALPFPAVLESLVTASKGWNLAPEVAAEFQLAWAQSRLDTDEAAQGELQTLSRTAPWTSQRSDALSALGRWHLAHARLSDARTALEAAAGTGDDLSVFKARSLLAQVTEAEGDLPSSARQRESAEKTAGPGVPVEFRLQVLREAADLWTKTGKPDDAQRVKKRIEALGS